MPPTNPFSSTIKKLEDLPSDGGHAVDVLAGANLRIFCRLQKIEAAYSELRARLATIEERSRPAPAPAASTARTMHNRQPGLRGSSAASRFALRQRSAPAAANSSQVAVGQGQVADD